MEQKLGYYFSIALEKPVHEVCRQELSWEGLRVCKDFVTPMGVIAFGILN